MQKSSVIGKFKVIKVIIYVLYISVVFVQHAIDFERQELMDENNQEWETLYKLREKDEVDSISQRIEALNEHNDMMTKIMVDHQELFRATKIALAKDVQVIVVSYYSTLLLIIL